ncbi:MAG: MarR family winged helix-turn-helix transcriptional regulator [Bacteroidales bacterium]
MEKIIELASVLSHGLGELEELAKEKYGFSELTTTQMHYIEIICKLQNPNVTELASALKLSKPTVTVGVDRLIEKGYITKVQSDDDRRNTHLHLTEKGEKFNEMHHYAHRKFAELIEDSLTAEEAEKLALLLGKITANF